MSKKWFPNKPRTFPHFAILLAGASLLTLGGSMKAASEASSHESLIGSAEPSALTAALPGAPSGAPCLAHATSWEIANDSTEDVDGLKLHLQGLYQASEIYVGERNPFGEPVVQALGPDGVHRLQFMGSQVSPGSRIQIAFCGDSPAFNAVPLGDSPAVSWLNAGESLSQASPLSMVGHQLRAESLGNGLFRLSLEITQAEGRDLRLENLEFALGEPRSLADLSYGSRSDLVWSAGEPANGILPAKDSLGEPARLTWNTYQTVSWEDTRALFARFQVKEMGGAGSATQSVVQLDLDRLLHPLFLQEKALSSLGKALGRGDLEVIHSTRLSLPLTGREAHAFKVRDRDGKLHQTFLLRDGQEVSRDELFEAEKKMARATFENIDPSLLEEMANADPDTPLKVSFWLTLPESDPSEAPIRPDSSTPLLEREVDSIQAAMLSYESARAAAVTGVFAARLREFAPHAEPVETDLMPVVHATLLPEEIEQVAAWREVDRVFGEVFFKPQLNTVRSSVRSFIPNVMGFDGTGEVLGVLEVGGRLDPPGNPFLPSFVQNPTDSCVNEHGTAVAGVIASQEPTHMGMAPGASLLVSGSCVGSTSELMNAAAWQVNAGAGAINLSLGSPAGKLPADLDRFIDGLSVNYGRTIVVAAGNDGKNSGRVYSPARAYNVISVGSYNDRNNEPTAKMSDFSSYVDPDSFMGDREKPEVAAPGTDVETLSQANPPIDSFSGTSFAAPVVTGGVGLLFDANPALRLWPEAVKAIMMATATDNIEGHTRLSDKDGAGGVRLDQAVEAGGFGSNNQWFARSVDCNLAPNSPITIVTLDAGKTTRIALVWGQSIKGEYYREPSADFDLNILSPDNNAIVASSSSFDNTYEIVEFVPAEDGRYIIEVDPRRCDISPKAMAVAWWQDPVNRVNGMGNDAEGAGMDIADLNNNGISDLVLMAYDAPAGANEFRYKVGFDLDSDGRAASWSPPYTAEGVGHSGEGAGAKVAYINGNNEPDLILMAYDAPSGSNEFRYRIGWDLDAQGKASSWSNGARVGGLGHHGDGASVEVMDFDQNGSLDMVFMAYDDPAGQNIFKYLVGFDLDQEGNPSYWGPAVQVGGVGHAGQGAGMTLGNLDADPRPEMILMANDSPPSANSFRYRIGWNLGADGTTISWSTTRYVAGLSWDADGADMALTDPNNTGTPKLVMMSYDDPPGSNTFRYIVVDP